MAVFGVFDSESMIPPPAELHDFLDFRPIVPTVGYVIINKLGGNAQQVLGVWLRRNRRLKLDFVLGIPSGERPTGFWM